MSSDVPIYAVDFDGTLCESQWPGIGAPNTKLIKHLIKQQKEGGKDHTVDLPDRGAPAGGGRLVC